MDAAQVYGVGLLRNDVLIDMKKIAWVLGRFHFFQAYTIFTMGRLNAILPLFHHHVTTFWCSQPFRIKKPGQLTSDRVSRERNEEEFITFLGL